jgi:pilus assembly protein CpaB
MNVETGWQRGLSRRWLALRRGADDRGETRRRSATIMLVAAAALGLVALWLARSVGSQDSGGRAVRSVPVVVAAREIGFGETLTPDKLKLIDWPAQALPQGSFSRIDELVAGPAPRAALRPIAANEILLAGALATGGARLSTTPLLGPAMRAMAVPVNDFSGVSGLVYPGDHVDVLMTRQPEDAMPHAELVAQNVRVLAVGTDMNIGKDKPEAVKSVTLEVTALQGQKLSLAIATATLSLALRHFSDSERVRLQTLQVSDLNDGTITRLVRKPTAGGSEPQAATPTRRAAPAASQVIVVRGTQATVAPVLR